jgi:hypothetical protein
MCNPIRPNRLVFLCVGTVAALAGIGAVSIATAQVIPPDEPVAGQSQLDLANSWWPWAFSLPIAAHPVLQSGDLGLVEGDQGAVFFLAGSTSPDPVTRNIAIPANTPLFFPLITTNNDNVPPRTDPPTPPTTFTAAELLSALAPGFDNATSLFLEIDGVPQTDLAGHRQTTLAAEPYSYMTTSDDNLLDQVFGGDSTLGTGMYPSTVAPAVQDGYWVALEGLAGGTEHTLHFGGTNGFGFTQDITYNLTVVPEPASFVLLGAGFVALFAYGCGRDGGRVGGSVQLPHVRLGTPDGRRGRQARERL